MHSTSSSSPGAAWSAACARSAWSRFSRVRSWLSTPKPISPTEANLKPVHEALKAHKIETELKREEEHSAWMVTFKDPTNAERAINVDLASQPEYRRLRAKARQTAKFNLPPFVATKDNSRETLPAGASFSPTSSTKAPVRSMSSATKASAR